METKHWATFWTPEDSIRDYFGDYVALYVCWLSLYTRYLISPALLGILRSRYRARQCSTVQKRLIAVRKFTEIFVVLRNTSTETYPVNVICDMKILSKLLLTACAISPC